MTIPGAYVPSLHAAFRMQYKNCNLKPGQTVALLTDHSTDEATVSAAYSAALEAGAEAYQIHIRSGIDDRFMQSDPFKAPGMIELLCKADLILCFFVGFFSAWERPAREAGARILNVLDTPSQMVALQTDAQIKSVVLAAAERLRNSSEVRALSDAGTDLVWTIDKELPVAAQYGMADKPGVLAQWGQAMVAAWPQEGQASGVVVVEPGDIWVLPYVRLVTSRIVLTVENGVVTKVEGGLDADIFRRTLDKAKVNEADNDPYAVSHLGWGLHPRAHYEDIIHFEGQLKEVATSLRSYPANFLFSTGPGPRRKTRGHIDMPLNNHTILIDNEAVIEKGRIVAEDMIADPARVGH